MLNLKNTRDEFGWVSISLHWIMAIALIGMYFLGDYMVDLDYYDQWYNSAPDLHRSMGVIIGFLMLLRLLWNTIHTKPDYIGDDKPWIKLMAKSAHYCLYVLVFLLVISGYLITTAKGQGIEVFGFFEIPALLADNKDRGELAGDLHKWMGLGFMVLVALHASAAFLHHYFHKDRTLRRMLGIKNK